MSARAATLALLLWAGPANAQMACTLIGCIDGLTIDMPADQRWEPGRYVFDVTLDGRSIRCTGALPLKTCEERSLTCNAGGVMITESGCAMPADSHGFGPIAIASGPSSIALTIRRDGQTIATGDWTPEYKTSRPNGPQCPPVCRQATVTLQLR